MIKNTRVNTCMENLSQHQLDMMLQHSYDQAIARQGRPIEEVFADLRAKHFCRKSAKKETPQDFS